MTLINHTCIKCQHFKKGFTCKPFPEGIPNKFIPFELGEENKVHIYVLPYQYGDYCFEISIIKSVYFSVFLKGSLSYLTIQDNYLNILSKIYLTDFQRFDLQLYVGDFEPYLLEKIDKALLIDIQKNADIIKKQVSFFNQSTEAKYFRELLESQDDAKVKKALSEMKQKGIPQDMWLNLYNFRFFEYFVECLELGLPQIQPYLKDLAYLDISDTQITEFPENLGNLPKLQFLYACNNQLSVLPESLFKLSDLEYLDLYNNQIQQIPSEIAKLQKLKKLYLFHNHLSFLPEEIGELSLLITLGISDNKLTSLPESIKKMNDLSYLYANNNKIKIFPTNILHLEKLYCLHIANNFFDTIPNEIILLKNLHWLNLSGNQLTTLPESIASFAYLEWLDLRDNPISESEKERIKISLPNTEILF